MVRAFIAIPLEDAAKSEVIKIIDTLKAAAGGARGDAINNVRWVEKDNIHLTLKFLGSINDQQVQRAKGAMNALKGMKAFRLDMQDVGAFPSITRPRVLWIGIKQSEQVKALFDRIEESISDINREDRAFSTHITIGRVNGVINVGVNGRQAGAVREPPLLEKVKKLWDGKIISSSIVDKVVLFQSILSPKGAVYRPLYEINLKKEAL